MGAAACHCAEGPQSVSVRQVLSGESTQYHGDASNEAGMATPSPPSVPMDASDSMVSGEPIDDTAGSLAMADAGEEADRASAEAGDAGGGQEEQGGAVEEGEEGGQGGGGEGGLAEVTLRTAPQDARFPATNQARRCYTAYNEYHKCIQAKGEGNAECKPFVRAYRSVCPDEWVAQWNELREEGKWFGKY